MSSLHHHLALTLFSTSPLSLSLCSVFEQLHEVELRVGAFSALLPIRNVTRFLGVHFGNAPIATPNLWLPMHLAILIHVPPAALLNTKVVLDEHAPGLGATHTECLWIYILVLVVPPVLVVAEHPTFGIRRTE